MLRLGSEALSGGGGGIQQNFCGHTEVVQQIEARRTSDSQLVFAVGHPLRFTEFRILELARKSEGSVL